MARTQNQKLGDLGEDFALKAMNKLGGCLCCDHEKGKIKKLVGSFAAVDLICEFCFQAYQVKTTKKARTDILPSSVRGAQYGPLEARKNEDIFHPLVIVILQRGQGGPQGLVRSWRKTASVWYLDSKYVEKYFDDLFHPYDTEIKKGKEKGRKLKMTTIKFTPEIKSAFVKLNEITYIEPFLGGGAVLFHLLSSTHPARPFLKWAGGKTQLLSTIESKFPSNPLYPLNRMVKNFIVSDINEELVLCYRTIQKDVKSVIKHLRKLSEKYPYWDKKSVDEPIPEERKNYFYDLRTKWNEGAGSALKLNQSKAAKRVAQTIFLNRTCFNGLFRVNSEGKFNVPIGSYVNPTILFEDELLAASTALQSVKILHGSYEVCEKYVDEDTFVYFDPPYRPLTTSSSFTAYSKSGFNDTNQEELAHFFTKLHKKGAKLMLSNSDPTNEDSKDLFFDNLYADYHIDRVQAIRAINSNGERRGGINELLIRNYTE